MLGAEMLEHFGKEIIRRIQRKVAMSAVKHAHTFLEWLIVKTVIIDY